MIIVRESAANYKISKPVVCSKCDTGKLGFIPKMSEAVISRRGNLTMDTRRDSVQVKCPVCGKLWTLTIE